MNTVEKLASLGEGAYIVDNPEVSWGYRPYVKIGGYWYEVASDATLAKFESAEFPAELIDDGDMRIVYEGRKR